MLRIFQQLPNQTLSRSKHFLTLKGLWQIKAQLWIWSWRLQKFWLSKSIFYIKNHLHPSMKFFSLKNVNSGAQHILMTLFVYCHFWSTLYTKIGPKFQNLIRNRALTFQNKNVLISLILTHGLMRKLLKILKNGI